MSDSAAHAGAPAPQAAPAKRKLLTRRVVEWSLWDWGSAAFNAVATTFVFSSYLTTDGNFTDEATASSHLSLGLTLAGLVIAALAPITGQRADRRGKGGVWLAWFTGMVVLCLLAMFFIYPQSPLGATNALWLGIGLLGLGNIFFEFASVSYNAMLNHIAHKEDMGRVSGIGWGAGYLGGIVLLLITYVGFISPEVGWFGVTGENSMNVRVTMLTAALWFAVFSLPVILHPPKPSRIDRATATSKESLLDSYRMLWATVRSLRREAPHTLFFLIASAVFRDGMAGVFTYGAIIGKTVFDFSAGDILIFAIAANVVAGVATFAFGFLDDLLGPKWVIVIALVSMIASGTGIFILHERGPIVFWILGLILSVFVGPVQSASRSLLARMIPNGREGEIFGLYATTGRAVSFMAPAMYLLSLTLGALVMGAGVEYTHWGILGIVTVLAAGLALTLPVKVEAAHLNHMAE
ncbi:MFS transporter [Schaalia sp. 19OD2882]|uniref:MFS transporter n=1 Tax=Schaalia sp. 19OD2882 TaxID=2794089 RepID=UPI001C1ECAEE|nr:MFS transporter [Schaalia sp. 19OD2882]QWW19788.1 MFS transporter [Schaalia sp. 19OD2882]